MEERLSMLVVEDNDIQRQAIVLLACDLGLPLDIEEAPNGKEAWARLQERAFDILFTDIKMPFMDGLALAEQAKQLCRGIQIIIYSAFDEFILAKKAIQIGVYQYILKPLAIDDFSSLMDDVIARCRALKAEQRRLEELQEHSRLHRESMRDKALLDLVYGLAPDRQARELLMELPLLSGGPVRMALADFACDGLLAHEDQIQACMREHDIFYLGLDASQCLLMIEDAPQDGGGIEGQLVELVAALSDQIGCRICLALSDRFQGMDHLPGQYARLNKLVEKRFFYEGSAVLCDTVVQSGLPEALPAGDGRVAELVAHVGQLLQEGKYDLAGQRITSFFCSPLLAGHSFCQIQYAGCRVLELLSQKDDRLAAEGYIDRICNQGSAADIMELLLGSLSAIRDQALEAMNDQLIQQVVSLIRGHYQENIGLEWLADRAGISAGYLSTYFKFKMGDTLSHYLAQYRVNCAIQLLRNTTMRINDVAVKAGYPNYSYFCTLFKKYTGMTPAQCRGREDGA